MRRIELILTERRRDLSGARARNYERLRDRLRSASGLRVHASHYEDVDGASLARATAIVLSGSSAPWSNHEPEALARLGEALRASDAPTLGICAGLQLQVQFAGGSLRPCPEREHGFLPVELHDREGLFDGLPDAVVVFHDHGDEAADLPPGFRVLASSKACAVQAVADPERGWWGTQFHPEEFDEQHPAGRRILRNFFELAL